MWKKALTVTAKLAGVLVLSLLALVALYYLTFRVESTMTPYAVVASPDDSQQLIVNLGTPEYAYGPHTVEVALTGERQISARFELHNDGANIRQENIEVGWDGNDNARVCLRGQEQTNQLITISVSEATIASEENGC